MRTSRIAQETAKLAPALSPRNLRRSTRSSLTATSPFPTSAAPSILDGKDGDADSPLSPAESVATPPPASPANRKRKRGNDTEIDSVTVATATRVSPRKNGGQVEVKEEAEIDIEDTVSPGIRPRKAKRQPAKRIVNPATGTTTVAPPPNWEATYAAIQEMRRRHLAPVDTVGCERLADERLSPRIRRFQHLVALMLSSQTKDTTTAVAMHRLRAELPAPGLTVENILAIDAPALNEMIRLVGFHNNKTKYLKATAAILREEYEGDIPDSAAKLMELPGVGPKMAHLCMSAAWGRTEGIGVDVHVHRITNLLGWHVTKGPEETRTWLEEWLPREKWHEINGLLVGLGQTICTPVGRKCGECVLMERGLCPSAVVERKKSVTRVREKVKEEAGGAEGQAVKEILENVAIDERTIEDVT